MKRPYRFLSELIKSCEQEPLARSWWLLLWERE